MKTKKIMIEKLISGYVYLA